jgi:glucose/arabinose dehydrogenase
VRRWTPLAAALLAAVLIAGTTSASAAPPAISTTPVLTGLSSPVFVTSAQDGTNRLFVLEQGGVIRVAQEGTGTTTPFLDITSKVVSGGERGLLGLAFHPSYETNGRFFVNYTRSGDGATVVSEFAVSGDPNVANPASEDVLFVVAQPFANHNGGMLAFGPDGRLYVGMGDGGSANDPGDRAQNPALLLGKMLRVDVNGAGTPEIFALGFRNPWRFSFDRADGRLLAGDVGQSQREEIDIVTQGENYGWRVFEGTMCTGLDAPKCADPSPYTMPIAEYGHTGGRCSVTGGYVYRGDADTMPPGTYVFADYCTGEIFVLDGGVPTVVRNTGMLIPSFGEDEAGELYVVNHEGSVHRIVADGGPGPTPTPCEPPDGPVSGALHSLAPALDPVAATLCSLGL